MALLDGILAYWNLNDDGSGGVSLVDSTGNGNTLANSGLVSLGTGIIAGDAVFNGGGQNLSDGATTAVNWGTGDFSYAVWVNPTSYGLSPVSDFGETIVDFRTSGSGGAFFNITTSGYIRLWGTTQYTSPTTQIPLASWTQIILTRTSGVYNIYKNGVIADTFADSGDSYDSQSIILGVNYDGLVPYDGQEDETGLWNRALSPIEVGELYNNGAGNTYPFTQPVTTPQYYNNAQNDGDWGNILNWWIDSGFTQQSALLPTSSTPINLYGAVTQNTQGANQCFCSTASFWSADFASGLTLQASGVVNMQGSSVMAGHTTDGVSMHDSSTLADTSVIDADVTMRDSSRAFGYIGGNAYVYYDTGNGQFPIGGTVAGSVSYLGWPAVTPQWFNDQVSGGADDGDFSNKANWWTDNNYTTRPVNAEGTQELPDASTNVFIAPNVGITANTGTSNPTINSVTAYNSNIQNISITATNGFLFSGNEGVENAVLYGNVTFQDTAYNYNAIINGTATYKSAASLQNSWNQDSLANLNFERMEYGSTGFVVSIPTGNSRKGFLSSLLGFPWYIRF